MVQMIDSMKGLKALDAPLHLALGVFDGLHIGHRKVIQTAVDAARGDGGLAGVLTFEPHPIRVLAPHVAPRRILASVEHKRELLREMRIDYLIVIPFTKAFAELEAVEFLQQLQESSPGLRSLSVGEDWVFGKGRSGNVDVLRNFGEENQVVIHAASAVMLDGERVSSTRVRQAIRDGNLGAAAEMLGREYTVLGTVIKGRQLGRTLGFPTANLRVYNEQLPCDGVWAVKCLLDDGSEWCGAGNLGYRPTVEGEDPKRMLEVHLLDYEGDLYGRDMEVFFLEHLRGEQKFDSLGDLEKQIAQDVERCREVCVSSRKS